MKSHAFDFRHRRTDPPVILVRYDEVESRLRSAPVALGHWIRYVAPSFTEFLGLAKVSDGEEF